MSKGFTLIELLAVIVILAIIALIATPIVLSIINDSKQSATIRSGEYYVDALQNAIMKKNMELGGSLNPTECDVMENGKVLCDDVNELEIEIDGEKPNSGSIVFDNGKVTNATLVFGSTTISTNEKGQFVVGESAVETQRICSMTDDKNGNGKADIGDMITCSTESFYVISNDGATISMLAQYNLDVGSISDGTGQLTTIENPTGIQNENAKGYVSSLTETYGVVKFSNQYYWIDSDSYELKVQYGSIYPVDVYDDNAEITEYINEYRDNLKSMKIEVTDVRLINYKELKELGCSATQNISCNFAYSWLYSTTYYTGVAGGSDSILAINSIGGLFHTPPSEGSFGKETDDGYFEYFYASGIRPVIEIPLSNIK